MLLAAFLDWVVGTTMTESSEKMSESTLSHKISEIEGIIERGQENRYQKFGAGEMNWLLEAEKKFAKWIGQKYCLGVASGGLAITLCLKAVKRKYSLPDDAVVFTNSFTFNAVPSSIVNARLKPVLVETDKKLLIDLEDLEEKIKLHGGESKKILLLSYMRGRVPDLTKVMELVERYQLVLIEDAAHAYGCKFNSKMIGTFGEAACYSTQQNKVMCSGEGGFLTTNCDDIMSYCIAASGSYENYMHKHEELCPPMKTYMKYKYSVPNLSCRMTVISGFRIHSQLLRIHETIEKINSNYSALCAQLSEEVEPILQHPEVFGVYDSLQIRLSGLETGQMDAFLKEMNKKFKCQKFLDRDNARFYKSWQFMDTSKDMPKTEKALLGVCDMRLKANVTGTDIAKLAQHINSSLAIAKQSIAKQS